MKKETMIGIGLGVIGVIGVAAFCQSYTSTKKVDELLSNMDKLADGINVDISDKIVNVAVNNAVEKAAYKAVKKATDETVNFIQTDISRKVSDSVKTAVNDISPTIQKKLEKELSLLDITDMKNDVVNKAAGIVSDMSIPFNITTTSSSTADIIKACTDSGMTSWDIERILKAADKQ